GCAGPRSRPRNPNKSSSAFAVGSDGAYHLGPVEFHLGPDPAAFHFSRANNRRLFLHQFNHPDTAIGLPFGGKSLLRREEALAGQAAIVIGNQFHNGIIPLPNSRSSSFLGRLNGRGNQVPPIKYEKAPALGLIRFRWPPNRNDALPAAT